ncbi:MAG: ribonuclease Z [Halobacteriales archaeon]|nr:ribonuclease Z [Halobacteriales archaeon]
MTLRVTFLGTCGAVPTTERNPSGVFINREGTRLLFDAGEGTQRQMMRFGTGFSVEAVFLTHLHGDHVLGLPGLLQTWDFNERSDPVTIYTPRGTGADVRELCGVVDTAPSYPVRVREIGPGDVAHSGDGFEIQVFQTAHRTRSVGYALVEEERKGRFHRDRAEELGVPVGPAFSTLHNGEAVELDDGTVVRPEQVVGSPRPGRRVVYTGDTRPTDAVVRAAEDADLLIHDATFDTRYAERARETGHTTAAEAADIATRAGAVRLVLTHISSRYTGDASAIVEEADEHFPREVILAHDGLTIDVPFPD